MTRHTSIISCILLLGVVSLTGCRRPESDTNETDPLLMRVRDNEFHLSDYSFWLSCNYPELQGETEPLDDQAQSFIFDNFERDMLLTEISQLLGLRISDDQVEEFVNEHMSALGIAEMTPERQSRWREEIRRRLAVQELLRREVLKSDDLNGPDISDDEVAAYFEANQNQFRRDNEYRIRFLKTSEEEQAQAFRDALKKTRKTFVELAGDYAENEGYMLATPMPLEALAEPFQPVVRKLKPGQYSNVIPVDLPVKEGDNEHQIKHFYVLYLESVNSQVQFSYQDAYHYIVARLRREQCRQRLAETLRKFREPRTRPGSDKAEALVPIEIQYEKLPFTYIEPSKRKEV